MAHYDIEADWHLLNACNYRCSDCFFGPETLGAKLTVQADSVYPDGLTRGLQHHVAGEPVLACYRFGTHPL